MRIPPIRGRTPVALTLSLAALAAGCGSSSNSGGDNSSSGAPGAAATKAKVMLSFPLAIVWTPAIVADGKGYFSDQGLDVDFVDTNGTNYVTQQLIAGNVDYGYASSGGALIAAERDPSLRVVGCNEQRNIFSINVMPDSSIQDVSQLAGKRIGVGDEGSGEAQLVRAIVNENHLDGVQIIPLGQTSPEQAVQALKSGEVDAFAAGSTPIAAIKATGVTFRDITPRTYDQMPSDCLMTKEDALRDPSKRATLVKLVRGLSEGALYARTNQEAAIDAVCKAVPTTCQGDQRDAFARPYMQQIVGFETPVDNGKPYQVNPRGWQIAADVMLAARVIDRQPDVTALTDSPEIRSIQREALDYDARAVEQAAQSGGAAR